MLPPESTLAMWAGAMVFWVMRRRFPTQGSGGKSAPEPAKPWSLPYATMGFKNSDMDDRGQIKPGAPREQLYDLGKDITQSKNLALDHPERIRSMRARLEELIGKSKARKEDQ